MARIKYINCKRIAEEITSKHRCGVVVERSVAAIVPFIRSDIFCKNWYPLETKMIAAGVFILDGR